MKPLLPFMRRQNRFCLAAALVALVLFAQWMGLRHRIEHADLIGGHHVVLQAGDQSVSGQSVEYAGDKSHSCKLFDGATLGDCTPLLHFPVGLQTGTQILTPCTSRISWDAPLLCHFSSRAPPRA